MHQMMTTRTRPSYDNVIATASYLDDEEDESKSVEPVSCFFMHVEHVAGRSGVYLGHGCEADCPNMMLQDGVRFVTEA